MLDDVVPSVHASERAPLKPARTVPPVAQIQEDGTYRCFMRCRGCQQWISPPVEAKDVDAALAHMAGILRDHVIDRHGGALKRGDKIDRLGKIDP